MNNDPNKRQVPVTYRHSGQTRLSEPVPVHGPRPEADAEARTSPEATAPSSSPVEGSAYVQPATAPASGETEGGEHVAPEGEPAAPHGAGQPLQPGSSVETRQKAAGASKPKVDIETLEQFIEYAYGRKGQRVTLKSKTERLIAQNPRLDEAAKVRLQAHVAGDVLLAVPRQLLLLSRDIEGFPALRAELASFVSNVMLRHPMFADPGIQSALRNLPEAHSATDSLATLAHFTPGEPDGKEPLKGAELQALRRNAVNLYVTWLANNRGMNIDDLAGLLFQVSWQPAARELGDDNARLRALTEVDQAAGVGLACLRFRQQAIEARSSQDQVLRDATDLRTRLAETDAHRQLAEEQVEALKAELEALRTQTEAEMAELQRKHAEERTHLHHGQEQLGGRLVRRLEDAVETLEVGLSALRNKTPRVEVMQERAELVVDALRAEIRNLREE
jgi:hypothetical protein